MAALLWHGPARVPVPGAVRVGGLALTLAGAAFSLAGVRALGRDLTPFVDPRPGAGLRTDGVYACSRNPVYAGLLAGAAGWVAVRGRPEPAVALAVLAAVLHVKTGLEEERLRERFGADYERYAERTPRLLGVRR